MTDGLWQVHKDVTCAIGVQGAAGNITRLCACSYLGVVGRQRPAHQSHRHCAVAITRLSCLSQVGDRLGTSECMTKLHVVYFRNQLMLHKSKLLNVLTIEVIPVITNKLKKKKKKIFFLLFFIYASDEDCLLGHSNWAIRS